MKLCFDLLKPALISAPDFCLLDMTGWLWGSVKDAAINKGKVGRVVFVWTCSADGATAWTLAGTTWPGRVWSRRCRRKHLMATNERALCPEPFASCAFMAWS